MIHTIAMYATFADNVLVTLFKWVINPYCLSYPGSRVILSEFIESTLGYNSEIQNNLNYFLEIIHFGKLNGCGIIPL